MATDGKYDNLEQLMEVGKDKGYGLYEEVRELLPADLNSDPEISDLLVDLDGVGMDILEEPKLEFDQKLDDGEELLDLDLVAGPEDKTNDPVRMYLREMGTVALLNREGEVEIARRIERGQNSVRKTLSRSPLVIQSILDLGIELERGTRSIRDVIQFADPLISNKKHSRKNRTSFAPSSWRRPAISARPYSCARNCWQSRAA